MLPFLKLLEHRLSQQLNSAWYGQTAYLGIFGKTLSLFYEQLQGMHAHSRKLKAPPRECLANIPIISVGNLTVGGTGKTPIVQSLAQYCESLDLHCLIISRGYKGKNKNSLSAVQSADEGDEAYWLQSQLKQSWVVATPNRQEVLAQAKALYPRADVIILDDAFQTLYLPRDLDIVLIDGQKGVGNGCLLPAGPLREPIESLKRTHNLILTKAITQPVKAWAAQLAHRIDFKAPPLEAPFQVTEITQVATGQALADKTAPVFLISGIAHPKAFETLVANAIANPIQKHFCFSDHHNYSATEIAELATNLKKNPNAVVITTGKDWGKLQALGQLNPKQAYLLHYTPVMDWGQYFLNLSVEIPILKPLCPPKCATTHRPSVFSP